MTKTTDSKLLKPLLGAIVVLAMLCIGLIPAESSAGFSSSYDRYAFNYYTSLQRWTINLVGHDLNGISLNGDIIEDAQVVSVSLEDVMKNGEYISDVEMRRGRLLERRHPMRARYLVGAILNANLDNGATVPIKIDGLYRGQKRETRHIHFYEVSYETDEGWQPLCGVDEYDAPIPAIPLEGRWDYTEGTETGGQKIDDPTVVTFGCQGFVLAKCVESGYAPWIKTNFCLPWDKKCETKTLAAHHQACTRMMRADYCGDGISHTVDDIPINPYDSLYFRTDVLDWDFEGEWDEYGAICMDTERIDNDVPQCMEWLHDDDCGDLSHFDDGTLLMSELSPHI